jgi:hypothetical protein
MGWDERIVLAIRRAAMEDIQRQRWARDFADKLVERAIDLILVKQAVEKADAILLYRHRGLWSIGFWLSRRNLVVVWSPRYPSRWVTAFWRKAALDYLRRQEDAEVFRSYAVDCEPLFMAQ